VSETVLAPRLTRAFAEFATGTAAVPTDVELVRRAVLDTLAVGLAATHTPLAAAVSATAPATADGATVLGRLTRAGAAEAARVNAVAAHALDFDDMSDAFRGHLSCIAIPAFLAVAEAEPELPGDVAQAYAVALQVAGSLAAGLQLAGHYRRGWHITSTVGGVATAAGLARLLGLPVTQTSAALGIAASAAGGFRANFGSDTKALHAGNAAHAAMRAIELARLGVTADEDALGAPEGFLTVFGQPGDAQAALDVLAGPGQLVTAGVNVKLLPCCYELQRAAEAAARAAEVLDPDEITAVLLTVHPGATEPLVLGVPQSVGQRQFSAPFVVAHGLLTGGLTLDALEQAALSPAVIALGRQVRTVESPVPPFGPEAWRVGYACLELDTSDGRRVRHRVDVPLGHASRPPDLAQLNTKVAACLRDGGYEAAASDRLAAAAGAWVTTDNPFPVTALLKHLETARAAWEREQAQPCSEC